MISRNAKLSLAGAIAVLGIGAFALVFTHATLYASDPEIAPPAAIAAAAAANATSTSVLPTHISIPAIGVAASVEKLGVTTGDHMAMPSSFATVGWYKYGPVPGAVGTAVMYGHLDNGLGISGVFKNVNKLKAGDKIQVASADGDMHTFVVDSTATYPYESVPAEVITGTADKGTHLNLITCAGKWVYDSTLGMTYDHRLVVYATLES